MKCLIILALCFACSAQTGKHRALFTPVVPVTFVNENWHFNSATVNPSNSVAFGVEQPAGVNAGDRLFAFYGFDSATDDPAGGTTTCTDTQGNTWTALANSGTINNGGFQAMYAFTTVAGSTGADTVTCTNSVTIHSFGENSLGILEYIAATLDGVAVAQGTANGQSASLTNNITTAFTDTLVVMSIAIHGHSIQITSPAGFTTRIGVGTTIEGFAADKTSVVAGANSILTSITGADVPLFTTVVAIH